MGKKNAAIFFYEQDFEPWKKQPGTWILTIQYIPKRQTTELKEIENIRQGSFSLKNNTCVKYLKKN